MSTFERYLTVWVFACIIVGVALGHLMPGAFQAIGAAEVAKVNLPVAVLIWLMIIPMLLKIDFASLGQVGRHWRGIGVTLFINWAVKPFSMALLGWIFIGYLFRPYLPAGQIDSYIAGLIILAAAPCTAMVFVWSNLTKGEPHFTLSQVALNDTIMVVAFAPIVGLLLGLSAITVPWDTLILSVVLYIVLPVIAAQILRRLRDVNRLGARLQPVSLVALLATLVLLFGFQGEQILAQPGVIALLAAPILIQVYFNSGLAYLLNRMSGGGALCRRPVGFDRRVQLFRTGGGRRHQPVRLQLGRGAGHGRRRPHRGASHAVGGLDRQPQQGLVRARRRRPLLHFHHRKGMKTMDVTIYHNPACGTSRNTLEIIRNAGIEPTVIEYLKTPPTRAQLVKMITDAGLTVRQAIREKGTPYAELGLDNPELTDDQLLDAMLKDPILINRPLVMTPLGTRLARPSEVVLDILPDTHKGAFTKEDGEQVLDAEGKRIV